MRRIIICMLWLGGFYSLSAQSLERQVIGTVGGYYQGTQVHLSYTGGELVTETLRGTITLTQGFQQTTEDEITAIDPQKLIAVDYRLFPNPTSGPTQLVLSSDQTIRLHWSLVDGLGRTLSQSAMPISLVAGQEQAQKLDLSDLPAGIYHVLLRPENGPPMRAFQVVKR
ncbi:MAG: hypothetical protein AAF927_10845 [Bacteroidota bacterium]